MREMKAGSVLSLAILATVFVRPLAAGEYVCLQAERFAKVEAERRNFGGVVGIYFPKKESLIRTSISLPKRVEAEIWARVYFPWAGQDAIVLTLGKQRFTLSARTAASGGRWDVGNFQVWHWIKAGTTTLQAGKHELSLAPAGRSGQRVDQIVLYWGDRPAWSHPWLTGGIDIPKSIAEWRRRESFPIPAMDFSEVQAEVETFGNRKVAVLRSDGARLRTVFRRRRTIRARLWARVYFEAKNMFEGLTMQELANNFYVSIDGELLKTVYEQNGRQWHWVATDEPYELNAGPHLITLRKQGLPVKVDQVVLHSGDDATAEAWFRSPPPPSFPFGMATAPEVARAGSWRAHSSTKLQAMTFRGEREGPARFPVRLTFAPGASVVDVVRVVGLAENPLHGDRTPAQQVGLWVKNAGQPLAIDVLYSDRHGEFFLQRLHDGSPWTGWRLVSANIPLRLAAQEAFFDKTGYALDVAATPPAEAGAGSSGQVGVRHAGGDRNATPDFPLEVRALRFARPAGKSEVVFAEPFFESPFTLRARLKSQTDDEATFEIEVRNTREAEKIASLYYRFLDRLALLGDPAMRVALLQRRDVAVPGRGKATVTVTLKAPNPGIRLLEYRAGQSPPSYYSVAFSKLWQEKRAAFRQKCTRKHGAFRFSPDGRDRPLKKPDGTPLRREEVAAAYGAEKGLIVLDDGVDVCSLAYAAKRDFAHPLQPRGYDLSDEAGWPHIRVPNGVLAIDPALGRFKFAEADPRKLSLRSAVQTGFGVPGPPVVVRGRFAYAGPGEGHYSVVDCSDKAHPRVVGQISSWYFSHRLLPFRNCAYFEASRRGPVLIDDLSNPYRPGPLRNVQFNRARYGRLTHVFEDEAVAYSVGGSGPALWAFDVSNPLYPREIARVDGPSSFFPCGRHAFAYVGDTIRLLDVSNPRRPALLRGVIPRKKWTERNRTMMSTVFAVSPDHLALRRQRRIDVYRYTKRRALAAEKVGSLGLPEKSGRHVFGAFHHGLLYVIGGKHGPGQYSLGATSPASRWFVFELRNGKAGQVGFYEHPWPSAFGNITIVDDTAYVADYNYGMWVFDLSNPRAPKRLGGAVTAGESDAIWLDGDRAYQWQTFGGAVFLLDISDPAAPQRLGEYWDGAWVPYGNSRRGNNTVAGKDGFLYIPRQRRGLLVVDVRDAAKPKAVGEFKDEQGKPLISIHGACIDIWGDRAHVLLKDRLLVYDVSRAAAPRLLSTLAIPEADCLHAKSDKLYLGHKKGVFAVVDVADAAKPAVLAKLDLTPYCPMKMSETISGLTVAKGHAYLTARGPRNKRANFLHIVDVRDPRQPRWVMTYDPRPDLPDAPCSLWSDFYQDIIADGDYLFIGDYGEIQCLDISAPTSPRVFDVLHVGYQWSVGRKRGPHLFVPALSGLLVLRAPSSSQAPTGKLEAKARF